MVDVLGLLLGIIIHPANWADSVGGKELVKKVHKNLPRIEKLITDQGYAEGFADYVEKTTTWKVEEIKRVGTEEWRTQEEKEEAPKGFILLPKRWVVERTFAWLGRNRRLSKEYDKTTSSAEAWCWLAMIRLLLRRVVDIC
jgi:putative transposase